MGRFFPSNSPARIFVNLILLSIGYSHSTTLVIELYTSVITQLSRSLLSLLRFSACWWWTSSSMSSICTICCGIIHVLTPCLSCHIQPMSSGLVSLVRPNTVLYLHLVYTSLFS
ncbi:uncharacterized protein BJ212DRAFT_955651 [Suillus subaureus]|uniref:Uncharacterized protein n=1 Tax=Suillus subaureus TaxID=48587 RepID=A0A9P7DUJ1_9AGAM|nr:uncharacterized protein BJ212DRAFT_955651 [Suillus subaureus]KAG1803472.1 hypothetical protein BJ212DRAFT_955651 [Suillus subaureus]